MTYEEFKHEVEKLSRMYKVETVRDLFVVQQQSHTIFTVSRAFQYSLRRGLAIDNYDSLPFSHQLWMLAAELAATPLNERIEHKYNVIIGDDNTNIYAAWCKTDVHPHIVGGEALRKNSYFQFTESEFESLIKHIKTLPDGEFQAKVAEHGKRLVKGGQKCTR